MKTREQIEADARLCARAMSGDESDCTYPPGSAAHRVWMAAYRDQCGTEAENARISYEMHPDHQPYDRMERL